LTFDLITVLVPLFYLTHIIGPPILKSIRFSPSHFFTQIWWCVVF